MADVIYAKTCSNELQKGDRVVGWASSSNGLAELIATEGQGLVKCDLELPPWEATVVQPLACVLYAVSRLPDVIGKDVAVLGLGPIGLLFSHVLKSRGAKSVTGIDINDRSGLAAYFGVTHFVRKSSEEWANGYNSENRPSIIIEAVGHQPQTIHDAIKAISPEGTLYCFGIPRLQDYPIDMTSLVRKNLTLIGGVTLNRRRAALEEACRHLARHPGLASKIITHVLPFAAAQKAYELASNPSSNHLKVAIVAPSKAQEQVA